MGTEPLSTETAGRLKDCHSIEYGGDAGWTVAYGKDEEGNLKIAVHAKSKKEFDMYFGDNNFFH